MVNLTRGAKMGRISLAAVTALTVWLSLGAGGARAETLIDQAGQPLGGRWQAMADSARTPSYAGDVTLVVGGMMMTSAGAWACAACSSAPGALVDDNGQLTAPWTGTTPTTHVSSAIDPWDFYSEMGHQFDWNVLTDSQRQQFAKLWGVSGSWWDTTAALDRGGEDGLEIEFAGVYANCADPSSQETFSSIELTKDEQRASCVLIDQIGGWSAPAALPATRRHRHHQRHRHRSTSGSGSSWGVE